MLRRFAEFSAPKRRWRRAIALARFLTMKGWERRVLKGSKAVESIDLSNKELHVASGIIIAACIAGNEHLRALKCAESMHN